MRKIEQFLLVALLVTLVQSCKLFEEEDSIYDRPPWLAGKLYAQMQEIAEVSEFTRCLEITGYDKLINTSGSFTVFAPNNSAFDQYLQAHSYSSVEDIPIEQLEKIVKYHIVQNPWSTKQLRELDVWGWIDTLDADNDEPRGFKRETLLRDSNRKYGVEKLAPLYLGGDPLYAIVDTLSTGWYRRQSTDARKYAPIFYKEYFDMYDLTSDDYSFYFNRPFEASNMYFAGAEIVTADRFAENGFIHIVDRVMDPPQNAYQILSDESGPNVYTDFLKMVNIFPEFFYNEERTEEQAGYDLGLEVDSLFDISYPELTFDILNEKTIAPSGATGLPSEVTIRYHHGLIAPTNAAFESFTNEYFVGSGKWGSLQNAPRHVKRMIVNTHMSSSPIYPTDFEQGFYNGEDDKVTVDQATIVEKQFASNCTFVGVNEVIVPRAFSSVTGPIYLQKGYSRVMYAIERAGLLPALKRPDNNYMFFVENDANLTVDSSLIYSPIERIFSIWQITDYSALQKSVTTTDLRNLIMNHIGTRYPTSIPRKEFIKNLAGNYLIVNNETGEVRGSAATTIGYQGLYETQVIPVKISTNADNGRTYDISNWFNFSTGTIYNKIAADYPEFQALMKAAGLTLDREYRYTFTSADENYTVFVPNAAALSAYRTDTLTTQELKDFLLLHFVQGALIFTDGYQSPGYYETSRVDEKSTEYTRIYSRIYINPLPDNIQFPRKNGTTYLSVTESAVTNKMSARTLSAGTETHPTIVTNGVIHEIDKVLLFNTLDTE
jgi:uncharacterized surface protein with fasciclin (FAS1) repeats